LFVSDHKLTKLEKRALRRKAIAKREIFITDAANPMASTLADVATVFTRFGAILREGADDVLSRYRRSFLGPLWNVAGTLVFVTGFMILGKFLFKITDPTYIVYVACGVVFWTFIYSTLAEGGAMYGSPTAASTGFHLSFAEIPVRLVARSFVVLLFSAPVVLGVSFLFVGFHWQIFLFIPGVVLVMLVLVPGGIILGVFGARLKDLPHAVSNFLQFGFYLSPVFWRAADIPQGKPHLILDLNPFYYFLELMRTPLLGGTPKLMHYFVVMGLAMVVWIFAILVFVKFRRRIIYWS